MDLNIKNQLISNYLSQQIDQSGNAQQPDQHVGGGTVQAIDIPDANVLEEFKNQVKVWVEIDNAIKKLQALIRERNTVKSQITVKILNFMHRYNIEDLNTKDGKLRYKVTQVKVPVNRNEIKERIKENYGKVDDAELFLEKLFESTVKESHKLTRLKARGRKNAEEQQ